MDENEIFAYADDLAVNNYGEEQMKKTIKIIEQWVEKNDMKINKKKSGIIFHKKKKSGKKQLHKKEIEGFPVIGEYKYLGIWIDETM